MEKDSNFEREMANQKKEWAEIYGSQKAQNDQMQREIALLNQENESILNRLEQMGSNGKGGANIGEDLVEATKRLKKRELECQALWDTLKDLKNAE